MSFKNLSNKKRKLLENIKEAIECNSFKYVEKWGFITAEEVAKKFNCTTGEVRHCFHILNLEGILNKSQHREEVDAPTKYFIKMWIRKKKWEERNKNGSI